MTSSLSYSFVRLVSPWNMSPVRQPMRLLDRSLKVLKRKHWLFLGLVSATQSQTVDSPTALFVSVLSDWTLQNCRGYWGLSVSTACVALSPTVCFLFCTTRGVEKLNLNKKAHSSWHFPLSLLHGTPLESYHQKQGPCSMSTSECDV